ncbi:MAG: dTMP kinase [Longimicrobiales bacterium]|nr:dTMP kinase [Longimicrobiales bacterium]
MSEGLFIVLEGIEGAGKSTQIRLLAEWMEEKGRPPLTTREPGGTDVGEEIREILLSWKHVSIPSETELFLILAARAAFVRDVVEPALTRGEVVLADRYDLSTLAYQGYGRELDLELVERANDLATGGCRPDLYLLLDIEVEEGLARQRRGGKEEDRIEGAGIAFLRRVREGYRLLAEADDRVEVVDAAAETAAVQERIRTVLSSRFPETFA